MPDDIFYMRRALMLAEKGRGLTSPNPVVGCVIVNKGKVLAEGWHQFCGGDHAEVVALKKAGVKARGATMYVTLEPCAHWGRTPPCVDAVMAAGIKRIFIAMTDPNKLVNGASVNKLRAAGLEVVVGLGESEAREINSAFIKYIMKKRPYVAAKTAQTLDGRIATRTGDSKWITSRETRAFARDKRNAFDAILVGINTVLCDDPGLDAPRKRIRKVVLDSSLRIPEKARLLQGAEPGQVIVAVTKKAPGSKIRRLEKRGICVILCPEKDGGVDLRYLFKALAKQEIASVLIEGGAAVVGSALKAGLVDELNVYISPKIMGDAQALPSVVGFDIVKVSQTRTFRLVKCQKVGGDLFLTLKE